MDLSIIIVNYKTKDLTLACIGSVFSSTTSYKYEIILIDNASNDGTIQAVNECFQQVVTIANTDNVGFSKANNQGIRTLDGADGPWTTHEAINEALGIGSANESPYRPDDIA